MIVIICTQLIGVLDSLIHNGLALFHAAFLLIWNSHREPLKKGILNREFFSYGT